MLQPRPRGVAFRGNDGRAHRQRPACCGRRRPLHAVGRRRLPDRDRAPLRVARRHLRRGGVPVSGLLVLQRRLPLADADPRHRRARGLRALRRALDVGPEARRAPELRGRRVRVVLADDARCPRDEHGGGSPAVARDAPGRAVGVDRDGTRRGLPGDAGRRDPRPHAGRLVRGHRPRSRRHPVRQLRRDRSQPRGSRGRAHVGRGRVPLRGGDRHGGRGRARRAPATRLACRARRRSPTRRAVPPLARRDRARPGAGAAAGGCAAGGGAAVRRHRAPGHGGLTHARPRPPSVPWWCSRWARGSSFADAMR